MKNTQIFKDKFSAQETTILARFKKQEGFIELLYLPRTKRLRMQLLAYFGYSMQVVCSEDQELIKNVLPIIKYDTEFKVKLLGSKVLDIYII